MPRDIALFHGGIDPGMLSLGERLAIESVRAPLGDVRDWAAIDAWAAAVASSLRGARATSQG